MKSRIIIKKVLYILFLLFSKSVYAQSNQEIWEKWNNNYPHVDVISILSHEQHYADSVRKNSEISPYYTRLAKYRFEAEYVGEVKKLR